MSDYVDFAFRMLLLVIGQYRLIPYLHSFFA
jgi:hypothetical protein